jgi:putative spermidine/putrescine transport system permease protein
MNPGKRVLATTDDRPGRVVGTSFGADEPGSSGAGPGRPNVLRRWGRPQLALLIPGIALLAVVFFYPVVTLVKTSFTDPQLGFGNYTALFSSPSATHALVRTIVAAFIVSACCLILAYPYAYMMTVMKPGVRTVMFVLVSLPFWTSLIARSFAWLVLEERGGMIESALALVGLPGHVLLGSVPGVVVALIQILLVYMVFPLYNVMSTIDRRVLDAAYVCGARRPYAFFRIYLPLTLPGISAGVSLVFLLTLGFYVTPVLLGSSHDALVAQIIGIQVNQLLDFPTASAYSVILLAIMIVLLGLLLKGIKLGTTGRTLRGDAQ